MILLHYREDTIAFISFAKYHFIWCELLREKREKFTEKILVAGGRSDLRSRKWKVWHSAVINFDVILHRGRRPTNRALSYLKFADVLFAQVSRIILPHFSEKLSTAFFTLIS